MDEVRDKSCRSISGVGTGESACSADLKPSPYLANFCQGNERVPHDISNEDWQARACGVARIEECRAAWRTIPRELKLRCPALVSQVQITETGPIVAIFQREGFFEVKRLGEVPDFEKLDDAENFAARSLFDEWEKAT